MKRLTLNQIKVYRRTIHFKRWEFSFSFEVMEEINSLLNKYNKMDLEVGGYLFAEEEMENKFYSVWTSKPHKNDVFEPAYYELDLPAERRMINKYCVKMKRKYIGIWHSHKEMSTDPSSIDIENAKNILKDLNSDVVFSLIFNNREINIMFFYKEKDLIKFKSKKIKRSKLWSH